jgi:malate dehydrogenase (oxaloacetate-decarboxylating)
MDFYRQSLKLHQRLKGKISINSKIKIKDIQTLGLAYTPGVAAVSSAIKDNPNKSYELTARNNLVAVITDGSAVLGLGNIGATAAMPVMEGKCALFKEFAGIDAFPICLNTQDTNEIVRIIKVLEPNFGGINLEDISAPRCFAIETQLQKILDIPVFHDDQHGTAIVVCAALINALKVVNKLHNKDVCIVINGAGAAGIAIAKLLLALNFKQIVMCDRNGILNKHDKTLLPHHLAIAKLTNPHNLKGNLSIAIKNADVFIGVSVANALTLAMAKTMHPNGIIFAMANPIPEIMPHVAKQAGIKVIGTGRSDFPNQINNVLVFPGIFKGTLRVHAKQITLKMKLAAVDALAKLVKPHELKANYIIPSPLDKRVVNAIANAVRKAS